MGYWKVHLLAESHLVTSLVLGEKKKKAFHHNRFSNAHTWLQKVKWILVDCLSREVPKEARETHIPVSFALAHEIRSCICHMVSNWANIWHFTLSSQPFLYSLFSSPTHTEALCSGCQRGQTGNTFFSLEEKAGTLCLLFFFCTGQDYFKSPPNLVPQVPLNLFFFFNSCFGWWGF